DRDGRTRVAQDNAFPRGGDEDLARSGPCARVACGPGQLAVAPAPKFYTRRVTHVARPALRFALLVAAYLVGAWVALWFVDGPDDITLIWPPAGVVFAALLLHGPRWWPFVAV